MTSLTLSTSSSASETPVPTPVAKLWNRTHATARLEEEMGRAKREGTHVSILLVQFDGLSEVADRLGYAFGDDMWRRALTVLAQDIKTEDLCCRLGGDEFLLILPGRDQAAGRALAERMCRRWHPGAGTRESSVMMSVGVAAYPGAGVTVQTLLGSADEDMQGYKFQNEMMLATGDASETSLQFQAA